MALDERYIIASDLEQYFVDKDTGLPLANGTLTFYRDIARNTPKQVFQLSGAPPSYSYTTMGAVITLSAVGTVQNNGGDNEVIYYYPYDADGNLDLYYVVCRAEHGVEQFTREAWPNVTAANNPVTDQFPVQNQISNPQFTNVFINEGISTTYTVSSAVNQVFAFAPNWDFVISGTGTVVIQRIAISGNDNILTTPPYVLDINVSSGIGACYLRQRFSTNSGLWSSTSTDSVFLSGTLIAKNQNSGDAGVQMFYVESSGGLPIVIVDGSFDNSAYTLLTGSTADPVPESHNTDVGSDGYVDVYLSFTSGTHIRISSIQVVPTLGEGTDIVSYETNSSNREEALQGDYYIPRLINKNMDSFLVAWDFPVSPFQLGSSGTITTTPAYIADQTIACAGDTGNVDWERNVITQGLQLTTAGTDDAFYIMQYLSGDQVKNMLGNKLSVNVFGYQSSGDLATMRIYLFRGSSSASFPTLPLSIGTVASNGQFTLTDSDWSSFERQGLSIPQVTLNQFTENGDINSSNNDYGFSGWEITDSAQISDTDKFAIVVTFSYPDASSQIVINSISVVPGDLPCRPSIKTAYETLVDSQYFYEKSYGSGDVAGTNTLENSCIAPMHQLLNVADFRVASYQFSQQFNSIKIAPPTMSIYNPAGTIDTVLLQLYSGNSLKITSNVTFSTHWVFSNPGTKNFNATSINYGTQIGSNTDSANPDNCSTFIIYHFVADSRLGTT